MLHVVISLQFSQPSVEMEVPTTASLNTSENIPAATLEFLGPEMASLQELLASLSTGNSFTNHHHSHS